MSAHDQIILNAMLTIYTCNTQKLNVFIVSNLNYKTRTYIPTVISKKYVHPST